MAVTWTLIFIAVVYEVNVYPCVFGIVFICIAMFVPSLHTESTNSVISTTK